MKKIVALVLAMVMVLGLATTAFAAKGGLTFGTASSNYDWNVTVKAADAANDEDCEFPTYTISATPVKDGVQMFWETATATDTEKGEAEDVELYGQDEFVKVVGYTDAVIVVVDGKVITNYADADAINELGWDAKGAAVTFPVYPVDSGDVECNTLYAAEAGLTFYFSEGVLYVASADANYDALLDVNGVAVFADAVKNWAEGTKTNPVAGLIFEDHDYEIETKALTHVKEGSLVKAYCQACKDEFVAAYTKGNPYVATLVFGDDNYELVPGHDQYHMALLKPVNWPTASGAVVPGTPAVDGDKVESPKTFDAGIAMYVGMSVMAAAGSAVVLKKKD